MKSVRFWLATSSPRVLVPTTQVAQNIRHAPRLSTGLSSRAVFGSSRRSLCSNVTTRTSPSRKFGFPEINACQGISTTPPQISNSGRKMSVLGTLRNVATQVNIDESVSEMEELARSYSASGDHKKAVQLRRQILDTKKRTLGENHPSLVWDMFSLAISLSDEGSETAALELRKEVVQALKRKFGDVHPTLILPLNELSSSYAVLGQFEEVIKIRQEVVDIQTKLQGEEHTDTLDALKDLAHTYHSEGPEVYENTKYYQKALELRRKVLDIRMRVSGPEHPDTISSKDSLVYLLSWSSTHASYKESMEMAKENLEMKKKVFGEEAVATAFSMMLLARATAKVSRADAGSTINPELRAQVLELGKKALAIMENHLAQRPEQAISTMSYIPMAFTEIEEYHESVLVYKRLLEACRSSVGDEHPLTLQNMNNLSHSLNQAGDVKGALEAQKGVVELTARVSGEGDPLTMVAILNLGELTYEAATASDVVAGMDKDEGIEEARRLYLRVYEAIRKHPMYQHSGEDLQDLKDLKALKEYLYDNISKMDQMISIVDH